MKRWLDALSGGVRGTRAALQFLTVLPLGRSVYEPRRMLPYFVPAGLVVGLLLALTDAAASLLWGPATRAAIDILLLIIVTGALHLDGVADTGDGLFAHHPPERALAIMKDSRVGAMGLTAVAATLLTKYAALVELSQWRGLSLLLIPAFARGGIAVAVRRLPYGRPDGGLGHPLFDAPVTLVDMIGLLVICGLALFMGARGIVLIGGFFLLLTGILHYYRKRMGCITGDMMGALIEWTETGLFLAAAVAVGS
jgi:adenosylcobinamide-GDP ribazoletransferase